MAATGEFAAAVPALRSADIDQLNLDPRNPRLGRAVRARNLDQEALLRLLASWTLEELAVSFVSSGFWPQEPLIVVNEQLSGHEALVVVEGNRRLAALKWMRRAILGDARAPSGIQRAVVGLSATSLLFTSAPYVLVDSRRQVDAFLGFRHVTGVKEWNPVEKAEFIARLIEEEGLSYDEIRKRIGSKAPHVRQLYIAFNLLRQIEDLSESLPDIALDRIEDKFSLLQVGLSKQGLRDYIGVDPAATPERARDPVPADKVDNLANVARWVFGTRDSLPLVTDSRNIGKFSDILESPVAREYLEKTDGPNFEIAFSLTEESANDLVMSLRTARTNIQFVLARLDLHREDQRVFEALWPVISGSLELAKRSGPDMIERTKRELSIA